MSKIINLMQHLCNVIMTYVSLACKTGLNAMLSIWFIGLLRLAHTQERLYANNSRAHRHHSQTESWMTCFFNQNVVITMEQPSCRQVFQLALPSLWRAHSLSSHMAVTYHHTGCLVHVSWGLNELRTILKLDKVGFRAFKVFLTPLSALVLVD